MLRREAIVVATWRVQSGSIIGGPMSDRVFSNSQLTFLESRDAILPFRIVKAVHGMTKELEESDIHGPALEFDGE